MTQYGEFLTGRELYRGAFGSVRAARRASDKADLFTVKTRTVDPIALADPEAGDPRRPITRFLAAAEIQARLAKLPGSHWAPVHAMGDLGEEAFVVSDFFPRSARMLIEGRARLDGKALHQIAGAVSKALAEIRASEGRPHGSLSPTNVLIDDRKGPGSWVVRVSDPAPPDASRFDDDSRSVAELIFQLVMLREWSERLYPISSSPEWARLGKTEAAWIGLLNTILDPNAPEMAPDELAIAVDAIGAGGGGSGGMVIGGTAAAVGLAVIAGGAWWFLQPEGGGGPDDGDGQEVVVLQRERVYDWVTLLDERIVPFRRAMDTYARRRGGEPEPGSWRAGVLAAFGGVEIDPCAFAGQQSTDRRRCVEQTIGTVDSPIDVGNAEARRWNEQADRVIGMMDTVRGRFLQDPRLERVRSIAAVWDERGWTRFADELRAGVIGPVESAWSDNPNTMSDAIEILDATVDRLLEEIVAPLETRWARVVELSGRVSERLGDDPVVGSLETAARRASAEASNPETLRATIDGFIGQAERVIGRLDERIAIEEEVFLADANSVRRVRQGETVDADLIGLWLADVERLSIPPEPAELDPRRAQVPGEIERVRGIVDGADAAVAALREQLGEEASAFEARLSEARAGLAAVSGELAERADLRWNRDTRPALDQWARGATTRLDEIAIGAGQARRDAEDRALELSQMALLNAQQRADEGIRQVREQVTVSPRGIGAIDAAWVAARDGLIGAYGNAEDYLRLRSEARDLETALVERVERPLWSEFSPPDNGPAVWDAGVFRDAYAQRVRDAIASVVEPISWDAGAGAVGGLDGLDQRVAEARQGLDAWAARAGEIIGGYGAFGRAVRAMEGDALSVRPAVEPPFDTLANAAFATQTRTGDRLAMAQNAGAGQAELLALVNAATGEDAVSPLSRLFAWRTLGQSTGWPSTLDQLRTERSAVDALVRDVQALRDGQVVDAARAEEILSELRASGPERWARVADRASTPSDLRALEELSGSFGVSMASLPASVGPRARFNFAAAALWPSLSSADEAAAENARDSLAALVEGYRGELAGAPGFDALAIQVAALAEGSQSAGPSLDLSQVSPQSVGWTVAENTGDTIVFSQGGLRMEFRLVTLPNGAAFYLATRELTVAETAWAVDRAGGIAALAGVWNELGEAQSGNDAYTGVRGFSVRRGELVPSTQWAGAEAQYQSPDNGLYPPGVRGAAADQLPSGQQPTGQTPLQAVSPLAAVELAERFGCRLPTESEWLAAYTAQPPAGGNLRDQSWANLWAHTNSVFQRTNGAFGDRLKNVFKGGLDDGSGNAAPATVAGDDGLIWFAPVDSGPGAGGPRGFSHLLGNVAEFVLPDSLAGAPDDLSWQRRDGVSGWASLFGPGSLPGLIGGSALSDPGVSPTAARYEYVSMRNAGERERRKLNAGIVDAGVRLAFSGSAEKSLEQRVADVLAGGAPVLGQ